MNQNTKKNSEEDGRRVRALGSAPTAVKRRRASRRARPRRRSRRRATSESWTMFYVQLICAAARCRRAAGRPRARAGAPACALAGSAGNQRFARVLPRVFDAASDLTIEGCGSPLAARRAIILISPRRPSTSKRQVSACPWQMRTRSCLGRGAVLFGHGTLAMASETPAFCLKILIRLPFKRPRSPCILRQILS